MFTISISPIAFSIGSIEVRWYGILIALAVLTVVLWMWRQIEKKKDELPTAPDIMAAPVAIISGIIGARLVHVFEQWDYYVQHPLMIPQVQQGGLAIYGGVLGATLGVWIYLQLTRRHEKDHHFGYYCDLVAPGIILAQAVGRIGCTLNGCCHGALAADWLPWSIVYTNPGSECVLPGVPVHPTQVYEIIFALITFAILLRLRRWLKPDGSLFLVYLIMYSAWRLVIGFWRVDMHFVFGNFGLAQAQIISLVVLGVCIGLLVRMRRHLKVTEQTTD
jgi:phosphatidylglycerol:prolipoprotein diacylglycerol transferase